jgi:hypothetical protein
MKEVATIYEPEAPTVTAKKFIVESGQAKAIEA